MPDPPPSRIRHHLRGGVVALAAMAALLMAVPIMTGHLGNTPRETLITTPSMQKDLGVKLQRMAFADAHVLPVYGSSELTRREPNRVDQFFASGPTGFKVCPVGQAGNTTLLMAEKIAALGSLVHGKKVAVLLSASWFRRPQVPVDHYAGNFSVEQATRIMLSKDIAAPLRRRFAARMLDYPDTLKDEPALKACVQFAATTGQFTSHHLQAPMLHLEQAALKIEDDLATLLSLTIHAAQTFYIPPGPAHAFSWEKFVDQSAFTVPATVSLRRNHQHDAANAAFVASFKDSKEWADFELLLDTLAALHTRPLIIAIPLDGVWEDAHGVTLAARDYYYDRLDELCAQRGFTLAHFPDHDQDAQFVLQHSSHLSGKGWVFVNHLLDDFYHDRLPDWRAMASHS